MLGLLALTACTRSAPTPLPQTGPVDVPVPSGRAAACEQLVEALPEVLGDGLARRPVTGDQARTAAWGDPVVTLACGTAKADPTAEVLRLGPSDDQLLTFAVDDLGAATAYTTTGLRVPVTVTVPDTQDATVLVPLVGLLRQTLR